MLEGCIVALITPMLSDNSIDYPAFVRLIEWHLQQNVAGFVVNGTTAESATLTFAEKTKLLELAVATTAGIVPVIAGTGTNSTQTTIAETKHAAALGANACMVVTPYYNLPTQQGLFEHFAMVADAVDCPIILYNVPTRTGCDLIPTTVIELSKIENIIGLKEATDKVERISILRNGINKEFSLLSGNDHMTLAMMRQGASGGISGAANVLPHQMQKLCYLSQQEDWIQADLLNNKLTALYNLLAVTTNPIPVKFLLHKLCKIQKGIRLPLTWLASSLQEQLLYQWSELAVEPV